MKSQINPAKLIFLTCNIGGGLMNNINALVQIVNLFNRKAISNGTYLMRKFGELIAAAVRATIPFPPCILSNDNAPLIYYFVHICVACCCFINRPRKILQAVRLNLL